jgi:hypothetical protein
LIKESKEGISLDNAKTNKVNKDMVEKMLGAFVPEDLYWQFKNTATIRKEQMKDAIIHAAYLYIDAVNATEEKQEAK